MQEISAKKLKYIVGGTSCVCIKSGHEKSYNLNTKEGCFNRCCDVDKASGFKYGDGTYDSPVKRENCSWLDRHALLTLSAVVGGIFILGGLLGTGEDDD